MRYFTVGDSKLALSEVGLGTWAVGGLSWENGLYSSGWAPSDDDEALQALRFAYERGVTHFDTADVYGEGHAEKLLGRALGSERKNAILSTKVGYLKSCDDHPYSSLSIRSQCERSLKNSGREVIDIYYFHHCRFGKGDEYLCDALETMMDLKSEGKIREIGLSAFSNKDFSKYIPIVKPAIIQARANLMETRFIKKGSPLIDICKSYGVAFCAFQPLDSGILTGKYSAEEVPTFLPGDHRGDSPKFEKSYLASVEGALGEVKSRFGEEKTEIVRAALGFLLYHENVDGLLVGFRSCKQVEIALEAIEKSLSKEDVDFLYRVFQCRGKSR